MKCNNSINHAFQLDLRANLNLRSFHVESPYCYTIVVLHFLLPKQSQGCRGRPDIKLKIGRLVVQLLLFTFVIVVSRLCFVTRNVQAMQ